MQVFEKIVLKWKVLKREYHIITKKLLVTIHWDNFSIKLITFVIINLVCFLRIGMKEKYLKLCSIDVVAKTRNQVYEKRPKRLT